MKSINKRSTSHLHDNHILGPYSWRVPIQTTQTTQLKNHLVNMLFINPILAIVAMAGATAASPTSLAPREIFSFSNWVESIIVDPQGSHLTPAEAVTAWEASLNDTQPVETRELSHGLTLPLLNS